MTNDTRIEISDGFVKNVLLDNQRLRDEAKEMEGEIARLKSEAEKKARDHQLEIYDMVAACGGNIEVKPDRGIFDDRRLFIDRRGWDRGATYRLVADAAEQPFPSTEVVKKVA